METIPLTDPRSEATRQRLIDTGLTLFGRYGFDGVTTRQLATSAQVNQASIPYHFGGKEGVYLAIGTDCRFSGSTSECFAKHTFTTQPRSTTKPYWMHRQAGRNCLHSRASKQLVHFSDPRAVSSHCRVYDFTRWFY